MKKSILIIFATYIAFAVMAQNTEQNIPGTYVETTLDAGTLRTLSRDFSIDRVQRNTDNTFNVRIWLSTKDFDNFLATNIPYKTVPQTRTYVQMANNYGEMTDSWNRYPTYGTYLALMDTFQTRFPNLCKIDTILATTISQHSILCAHISNNINDNEGKPSIFYISTIHGDEVTGYYMMLRLINHLLTNYNTDDYITELVDNTDIWICPLYNPDGTYYFSNNRINDSPISIRTNRHGEDLNRSFPIAGQPFAKANYEPEVEAMMEFMSTHNFTLAANLHGGSEVFNYPWDLWESEEHSHADAAWWNLVGRQFADTCHLYSSSFMTEADNGVTEGGDWYIISGSMQDYHNWYLGTRHVTIEVSNDKVLSSYQLPYYWNYIRSSFLHFIEEAGHGIHGTVTDSITGEPLEALVFIANHDLDHSYVETTLPYGDYHRPIKAGQYAVTYSADGYLPKTIITHIADGQRLEQNVQLTKSVGIDDYEQNITIYPNPARDVVHVEVTDGMETAGIALYDMHGRAIETFHETSLQRTTINVSGLSAGTYFIVITTDKGVFVRKVAVG